MEYLHNNRAEFLTAINLTTEKYGVLPAVAEKDYYVTLILKGLAERLPFIVFKGGTSLSKCHKVIKRFSEDIDVAIDEKLTQSQQKKVKEAIKATAEELALSIPNLDETRSRRSYNQYVIAYHSVLGEEDNAAPPKVLLETTTFEVSFPTVILPVHSYIGDMMEEEAPEAIEGFLLEPFTMKVQDLDRTLIDKTFAICDYYMSGATERHSRHLYDIAKLLPAIHITSELDALIDDVRDDRRKSKNNPSAQLNHDIPKMLKEIIDSHFYESDYNNVTKKLLYEDVSYEEAIGNGIAKVADMDIFEYKKILTE